MKKSIFLLGLVAMMALSCTEDKDAPMITLTSQNELTVPAEGGTLNLEFNSNVAWTASVTDKDFVTISPASGNPGDNSVKVTFLKNDNTDPRTTNVTIVGETASATVKITQLQKNALVVPEGVIEIGCNEYDTVITVSSNADFKVEASVDWITVAPITKGMVDSQVGIHVALNKGDEARVGTINFTGEGFKQEVTIKQGAFEPMLYMSYDNYEWEAEGGTLTFTVVANVEYQFIDPNCAWITITKEGDTYTVTADPDMTYFNREVHFKAVSEEFTMWDDNNWDGEMTDDEIVPGHADAYFVQYGLHYSDFFAALPSFMQDAPNPAEKKNEYSIAITENYWFIATGVSLFCLDSEYQCFSITLDKPVRTIDSDDAGNIAVEFGGEFEEETEIRAYTEQELIHGTHGKYTTLYQAANGIYGYGLSNIKVTGDIFGDAAICLVSAGPETSYQVSSYAFGLQVKGGEVTDYITMTLPTGADIWSSQDLVAEFATPDIYGGIFYMGYDSHYDLCYNSGVEYDNWKHVLPSGSAGNEGYNAMDIIEWNGHKYIAYIGEGFFPTWGCPSYLWLANIDDPENPEIISLQDYFNDYFDLTWVYSNTDVVLAVEGNDLVAYVIDGEQQVLFRLIYPAM